MPRLAFKTCKSCGRHTTEVGPLSWTRLCGDCGPARHVANNDQIHEQSGPFYDHWRRRSYMAARRLLLDDVLPRE